MNDLNYQLNVQPSIYNMLHGTEDDLANQWGISRDDFRHAVFSWIMDKTVGNPPLWMIQELHELRAQRERQNTIEGEVGE